MNSDEARVEVKDKPLSFLHVDKSEIDLPPDTDLYDEKVYAKAKENLYGLIEKQALIQDAKPCLYLYQQTMGNHKQVGIVACASVEEYEANKIKKHEHTRADKEADRIKHVDITNANTGPIFLTYKENTEIDTLIFGLMQNTPVYDFVSEDEIGHTFWIIECEETIAKLSEHFKGIDSLYIADGHHRCASGVRVGQRRREANPNHTGDEEYNFFLAVIFPANQLMIMDYNRVVKDLNGNTEAEFMQKVAEKFEIEKYCTEEPFHPQMIHTFGMYISGTWYKLTAKTGTYPAKDPVKSLDVSIMQDNLLNPILGIGDPRTDKRIDFVGGIRGLGELSKRVDSGREVVAFSMFPTSIEELMNIADQGEVMPPKSTWFEPKLRSGLIVHLLS